MIKCPCKQLLFIYFYLFTLFTFIFNASLGIELYVLDTIQAVSAVQQSSF